MSWPGEGSFLDYNHYPMWQVILLKSCALSGSRSLPQSPPSYWSLNLMVLLIFFSELQWCEGSSYLNLERYFLDVLPVFSVFRAFFLAIKQTPPQFPQNLPTCCLWNRCAPPTFWNSCLLFSVHNYVSWGTVLKSLFQQEAFFHLTLLGWLHNLGQFMICMERHPYSWSVTDM
jgi:hypothetical protein